MKIKKSLITISILLVLVMLAACGSAKEAYYESLNELPNSGEIEFHDIKLIIPDGYIRDSTMDGTKEGTARRWEKGMYSSIVTVTIHNPMDINEESLAKVKSDFESFSTGDVEMAIVDFNGVPALESAFPIKDGEIKYLIFNVGDYSYDYSVQGDTADYEVIKESIQFLP